MLSSSWVHWFDLDTLCSTSISFGSVAAAWSSDNSFSSVYRNTPYFQVPFEHFRRNNIGDTFGEFTNCRCVCFFRQPLKVPLEIWGTRPFPLWFWLLVIPQSKLVYQITHCYGQISICLSAVTVFMYLWKVIYKWLGCFSIRCKIEDSSLSQVFVKNSMAGFLKIKHKEPSCITLSLF